MRRALLAFIIAGAVALRLFLFWAPCEDHHGWRQVQNLTHSREILEWGWEGFFFPVFPGYGTSGHVILELPLIQSLIALIYKCSNLPLEQAGRVVGILFSVLGMLCCFIWTLNTSRSTQIALFAAAFWACLPLSLFFGRTPMLEIPALFFYLCTLIAFKHWANTFNICCFWLGTLSVLALGFIRPHFLIPLAFGIFVLLIGARHKLTFSSLVRFSASVALLMVLVGGWFFIGNREMLTLNPSMSYKANASHYLETVFQASKKFKIVVFERFIDGPLLTFVGFLLCLAAFVGRVGPHLFYWVNIAQLLGVILETALFVNLNYQHTYYQLVALMPCIPLMAAGFRWVLRRISHKKVFQACFVILLLVVLGMQNSFYLPGLTQCVVPARKIADAVNPLISDKQKSFVFTPLWPENYLHCWRLKGCCGSLSLEHLNPFFLEALRAQMIDVLVLEFPMKSLELKQSIPEFIPESAVHFSHWALLIEMPKVPDRRAIFRNLRKRFPQFTLSQIWQKFMEENSNEMPNTTKTH